jgi:O-antigen/teichoic acid export membrane protein
MIKTILSLRQSLQTMSLLWVGSVLGAGLAFVTQILVARQLTPAGYGIFAASLAIATSVSPLASFGQQGFLLKVFGIEGHAAKRWIRPSFIVAAMTTCLTGVAYVLWATYGTPTSEAGQMLYWLTPLILSTALTESVAAKCQLEQQYYKLTLWNLLPNFARFLLAIVFIALPNDLQTTQTFAIGYGVIAVLVILIGLAPVCALARGNIVLKSAKSQNGNDKASSRPAGVAHTASQSWPFGLEQFIYLVYFQVDIIMLKYFSGDEQTGIYAVGVTIISATYLLPSAIYQKFLIPKFHRWSQHDRLTFLAVYRIGNAYMLLAGATMAAMVAFLGPWVIPMVFGTHYNATGPILMILALCIPARYLVTSIGSTLVTQGNMKKRLACMGIAGLVNIVANVLLLPAYGATGAAIATVIGEFSLLILFVFAVKRHVFGREALRGWTLNPNTLTKTG